MEEHGPGSRNREASESRLTEDDLAALPGFPCSGCGSCCRDVSHVPELAHQTNPVGRCLMLSPLDDKTCLVYAERPLVCRVDDLGRLIRLTPASWRALNRNVCHVLHERVHQAPLEKVGEVCRHRHPNSNPVR